MTFMQGNVVALHRMAKNSYNIQELGIWRLA